MFLTKDGGLHRAHSDGEGGHGNLKCCVDNRESSQVGSSENWSCDADDGGGVAGDLVVVGVLHQVLKWRHPGFLVPWMIAYFFGLCTSFFRTAVMIIEEVYEKEPDLLIEPICYSLAIGVVFSLVWIFVYTLFKELKAQPDERPAPVEV